MKRLLLPLAFLGCATTAEDPLPPSDALPERDQVTVAAERIAVGAISLTLDTSMERDGDACILHATVKQAASDDGPVYEQLGDHWRLERGYVVRGGGAWSETLVPAAGSGRQLEGRAKGLPRLGTDADVVVRLVRTADGTPYYLARRNVPIVCDR